MHIILASRSPRRIELLTQIQVSCTVMPADIDESVRLGELAEAYVQRLALEKAQAVRDSQTGADSDRLILAADTTVALNGEILGKPEDDTDAVRMLNKLSGTTHQVHTAIAICGYNCIMHAINTTQVTMKMLSETIIQDYVKSGEHRDKAGSYGIQGLAGAWIQRIDGSYSGVMGLPLYETAQLLSEMKEHNWHKKS
ncbi:MAG: septum formation inhibitor Maf [Methylophilaceae bacterium 17-44-8]|jgi:septum formation protein|nr:MAG: septum formation inhibitor Maf [Methylophilales bacterium 28-44-11]OZA04563.1 MAG: septum formation inhibitor Maf [Methylophilaceae bacterium 17-44-8]